MSASSALLLDLDGTLSDNFAGIAASIRHALRRLGAPEPDDAMLRCCVGPPLRESFARLLEDADPVRVEHAIEAYRERYRDVGWRENVVYAGVPEALASLAGAGVRMFVCTSKPEVFAKRIVAHFGFDAYVRGVYGADLVGSLDDKRKLLAHVLASETLDPATSIMVGDRHHDVRAGRANGTRTVGVLWGYGSRHELEGAERLLAQPHQLAELAR
jgi:phosphoglycolate phosphatase